MLHDNGLDIIYVWCIQFRKIAIVWYLFVSAYFDYKCIFRHIRILLVIFYCHFVIARWNYHFYKTWFIYLYSKILIWKEVVAQRILISLLPICIYRVSKQRSLILMPARDAKILYFFFLTTGVFKLMFSISPYKKDVT